MAQLTVDLTEYRKYLTARVIEVYPELAVHSSNDVMNKMILLLRTNDDPITVGERMEVAAILIRVVLESMQPSPTLNIVLKQVSSTSVIIMFLQWLSSIVTNPELFISQLRQHSCIFDGINMSLLTDTNTMDILEILMTWKRPSVSWETLLKLHVQAKATKASLCLKTYLISPPSSKFSIINYERSELSRYIYKRLTEHNLPEPTIVGTVLNYLYPKPKPVEIKDHKITLTPTEDERKKLQSIIINAQTHTRQYYALETDTFVYSKSTKKYKYINSVYLFVTDDATLFQRYLAYCERYLADAKAETVDKIIARVMAADDNSSLASMNTLKGNSESPRKPKTRSDTKAEAKKEPAKVKEKIGTALRLSVWKQYCGESLKGNCYCCGDVISYNNWDCSHVVAEANNGTKTLDNLRPCCRPCNLGMKTQNLYQYILDNDLRGAGRSHIGK